MEKTIYKLDSKASKRFYSKINRLEDEDACHLWIASTDTKGYGNFQLEGRLFNSHRIAYAQAYGDFNKNLHCLHSCDRPSCCNPKHLWLGTNADNVRDREEKGRGKVPDNRGEKCGGAKLTNAQALEIRALYAAGTMLQKELAARYKVSRPTISLIVNRKTFQHI